MHYVLERSSRSRRRRSRPDRQLVDRRPLGAMRAGAADFVINLRARNGSRPIRSSLKIEALQGKSLGQKKSRHADLRRLVIRGDACTGHRARSPRGPRHLRLIEGESVSARSECARVRASERVGRPFVTVNCGAIPENLVRHSFGHEKALHRASTSASASPEAAAYDLLASRRLAVKRSQAVRALRRLNRSVGSRIAQGQLPDLGDEPRISSSS